MGDLLTKDIIDRLVAPEKGNRIVYDTEVPGFGVRITSAGARSFVLNYRTKGVERRITIGSYSDWKVGPAREYAKKLKRQVDVGEDPMAARHADRAATTINGLADRFITEHLPKRRPATQSDYKSLIRLYIRPALGTMKARDVRHTDIEHLHARITKHAPYSANRTVAVLSRMMSLAIKWEVRPDNPVIGIERAPEEKRERYLSEAEIARLGSALLEVREVSSANAIRLMLITGARRSEVLRARWQEIDLEAGTWTKPRAHMKGGKAHKVPLSNAARLLLAEMRSMADEAAKNGKPSEFVFPGEDDKPLQDVKKTWAAAAKLAGFGGMIAKLDASGKPILDKSGSPVMVWKGDTRLHDLRHTYASILASSGLSLPIIGKLLGHTQTQTTARYAHLFDDPLRIATEKVGVMISTSGAFQMKKENPEKMINKKKSLKSKAGAGIS